MNEIRERIRQSFESLNHREQKLVAVLGIIVTLFILGLPLLLMHNGNAELESENMELQGLIDRIQTKAPRYAQLAKARSVARQLYEQQTPPLGSFVEAEAKKQGLTVKEVNDQPEKSSGGYLRRSVNVSLPGVELTPTLNLMSSIVTSRYPVAIEQVQMEHYQSGDRYNVKLGVLTYDRTSSSGGSKSDEDDEG